MIERSRRRRLVVLLMVVSVGLLDFPVLAVVDRLAGHFGPELFPAFIFAAWASVIVAMALLMRGER